MTVTTGSKWWGPITPLTVEDVEYVRVNREVASDLTGKKLPGDSLPDVSHLRWQDDGACVGQDVNLFVPEESRGPVREPKSFCQNCPVVDQCLQWALDHDEYGIWGNTTRKERQAMKTKANKAKPVEHGTARCYKQGCKRDECRVANAEAERQRDRRANNRTIHKPRKRAAA